WRHTVVEGFGGGGFGVDGVTIMDELVGGSERWCSGGVGRGKWCPITIQFERVVSTGAFIVLDVEEIRLLLKEQATTQQQQADAFQAQVATLYPELQATRTLIQSRQGGGGDLGPPIPRSMRLDVPKSSGNDPDNWIFSINTYFSLLATPADQRLRIVGFNLEDDAKEWFCWMTRNWLITTWEGFWRVCRIVLDHASMKILKGRYPNCYKQDQLLSIKRELMVANPTSLGDAFSLARVTKARLEDQRVSLPTSRSAVASGSQTLTKTASRFTATRLKNPKPPLLSMPVKVGNNSGAAPLPMKWLSPAERQDRLTTHDYSMQTMEFTWLDQGYTLQREESLRMKRISLHHMRALLELEEIYEVYELYNLDRGAGETGSSHDVEALMHPDIEQLIAQSKFFFSKKRWELPFRVDYCALNEATIKEKFPIPTTDEMFDELGGAVIFTKLDLRDNQFYVRKAKCVFGARSLEYLGHIIPGHDVKVDSKKVSAANDWPVPTLQRQGELEEKAFQALKDKLTHAPILGLLDFKDTFVIEAYASAVGIGAVLLQKGQPLGYFSRKLGAGIKGIATLPEEEHEVHLRKLHGKSCPSFRPLIHLTTMRTRGPSDTHVCYHCTFDQCGNILIHGTCLKCNSRAENSFTYDLIPESFNEVQIIPNPPPQSHLNIYLCQICESNSHYGYECSQRVLLVYKPEPFYNQNFSDNDYSHELPSVTPLIEHQCCYKCGDSLNVFFCHQCTCKFCGNGAHDGYNCSSQVPFIQTLLSFPQQYPCCEDDEDPHETFQCQPMNYFESNQCYDSNYFGFDLIEPPQYSVNPSLNIKNEPDDHELFISKLIQLKLQNEYAQPFPAIAITFDLPTVKPEDSLRMGDEHLDTIPKTESDEFIKSTVENLFPSPSESEDLSDSECDALACDNFTTFSNLLFDADDDFSSSDDKPFSNEDISKKLYLNPLFDEEIISMKKDPHHFNAESDLIVSLLNHDYSIISSSSSKIDSLLDEFTEIRLIEKLLYDNSSPRPPKEFIFENSDAEFESFSPSPIFVDDSDSFMEEIDLSFTLDDSILSGIEEDDYDSEVDMLILEKLLRNDSLSLSENESFHFDISSSSRPPAKPPDDLGILTVKVVDDIFEHDVPMPRLLPTQPTLVSNQEKSPYLLSHRSLKASQLHSVRQMESHCIINMAKQLVVLVLGLIAFRFALTSNANTYIVGDNSGWDISTNLDTWKTGKKFVEGDVLVFQYASTDSLCEVGKESYQTCNTTNVIKCFSDGNTTIPLPSPGERYFFCGNRLYCYSGMKLDIIVERNQSALAEAPLSGVPEAESGGSKKNNNPSSVVPSDAMSIRVGSDLKFKEDFFTYCTENGILQDSFEPSNDNTNVVNALQEPFVVNQDHGRNSSQSPPQINHHCCYGCGDSLEDIFCHQCTCELCGKGAHYGYNCPQKVQILPNPKPFNNQTVDELPQTLPSFDPTSYSEDENSFTYDSRSNLVQDSPNVFNPPPQPLCILMNFAGTMLVMVTIVHLKFRFSIRNRFTIKTLISRKAFMIFNYNIFVVKIVGILMKPTNIPVFYDDDDDKDYTIAITYKEPDNSLSMGDEHLDTIPATESNEFIKSSVENLVPNPSESEGEYECDIPAREDFTTFSNILFDFDYNFFSIDLHHFNVESDLIKYLLNHDSPIISSSSKIDSLCDEFVGKLTLLKSISPGINETDCDPEEEIRPIKRLLYDNSFPRPPEEFISENSDTEFESFFLFPIPVEDSDSFMEEIDLSFTPDDPMPPGIEEDDYDSERDVLFLKELLSNDSLSLPENESFHFDIPSSPRPPAKPPYGNTGILNVKVMGDISEHKVPMPRLMLTQPTLVPNQEKAPKLLPHMGHEAFQPSTERPVMIYRKNTPILDVLFFHFYPP
nr:blue copper protein [Tanacetum cinerariifolium]